MHQCARVKDEIPTGHLCGDKSDTRMNIQAWIIAERLGLEIKVWETVLKAGRLGEVMEGESEVEGRGPSTEPSGQPAPLGCRVEEPP